MTKVGIAVSGKKLHELTSRGFFNPTRGGVEYVPIIVAEDLGEVDLVLSKVHMGMEGSLVEALSNLPSSKHIVSPATQKIFQDRYAVIEKIWTSDTVMVPDSALVTDDGLVEAFLMEHERVILKPRQASGPKESHEMLITGSVRDVKKFMENQSGKEVVVQEVVDHDGWFFKLFVLGDRVEWFVRKSFDDSIVEGEIFNSRGFFKAETERRVEVSVSIANRLIELGIATSKLFECDLVGMDVVLQFGCNKLLVVDVNYFPTYSEFGETLGDSMDCLVLKKLIKFSLGS
jgi:glutathione synthase/RimK-type ligase-like ATP-grasp enzyme